MLPIFNLCVGGWQHNTVVTRLGALLANTSHLKFYGIAVTMDLSQNPNLFFPVSGRGFELPSLGMSFQIASVLKS
jgi:hypothetical protein